ncbi:hypothetical protein [Globicatella sanguinis]
MKLLPRAQCSVDSANDPRFVNQHISGVGHIGLTDIALVSPILTNAIDDGLNQRKAPETLLELNEFVLEFLESPMVN